MLARKALGRVGKRGLRRVVDGGRVGKMELGGVADMGFGRVSKMELGRVADIGIGRVSKMELGRVVKGGPADMDVVAQGATGRPGIVVSFPKIHDDAGAFGAPRNPLGHSGSS